MSTEDVPEIVGELASRGVDFAALADAYGELARAGVRAELSESYAVMETTYTAAANGADLRFVGDREAEQTLVSYVKHLAEKNK